MLAVGIAPMIDPASGCGRGNNAFALECTSKGRTLETTKCFA